MPQYLGLWSSECHFGMELGAVPAPQQGLPRPPRVPDAVALGWSGSYCRRHPSGAEGAVPGRALRVPCLPYRQSLQISFKPRHGSSQTARNRSPPCPEHGLRASLPCCCGRASAGQKPALPGEAAGASGQQDGAVVIGDRLLLVIGAGNSRCCPYSSSARAASVRPRFGA